MKHGRHLNFKKKRAIILIGFSCWQLSGFLTYIPYIHHLPTSLTDIIYQYHLQTSLTNITYCQILTSPYLLITYLHSLPKLLTYITYLLWIFSTTSLTNITYRHHLPASLTVSYWHYLTHSSLSHISYLNPKT